MIVLPGVQNSHMEELICVENRQDDIFKFDEELIEVQCETSRNNNREEAKLSFSEWLEVDEPLAVWFKVYIMRVWRYQNLVVYFFFGDNLVVYFMLINDFSYLPCVFFNGKKNIIKKLKSQ